MGLNIMVDIYPKYKMELLNKLSHNSKMVLVCIAVLQNKMRQANVHTIMESLNMEHPIVNSCLTILKRRELITAKRCPTFFKDVIDLTERGRDTIKALHNTLANVQEDSVEEEHANISGQSDNQFESERSAVT